MQLALKKINRQKNRQLRALELNQLTPSTGIDKSPTLRHDSPIQLANKKINTQAEKKNLLAWKYI